MTNPPDPYAVISTAAGVLIATILIGFVIVLVFG